MISSNFPSDSHSIKRFSEWEQNLRESRQQGQGVVSRRAILRKRYPGSMELRIKEIIVEFHFLWNPQDHLDGHVEVQKFIDSDQVDSTKMTFREAWDLWKQILNRGYRPKGTIKYEIPRQQKR